MRSGVLILDEKGRIVDVNPAAYIIFNRRNVLGTHISQLLEEFNLSLEELRQDPSARKEVHIGNDIYDLMITEVRSDNKKVAGEILNFFNITALKRTEKELSELNTTKDKFFSIIAHDLKNPFYGIMGLSEILASDDDDIDDEEKKMLANEIKDLATNTYRMLDNLLDWSRSQTGRLEFNPHKIDLSALIAENFSHLKKSAAVKKISLTSEVPSPTAVFADTNMLNTIFRNLISNAIKFTQPGGEISVSRRFLNNSVIISVTDNGIGMNQKTLDQIFRLDKSIQSVGTAGEKGTGLGMVLCKEFIERNGGKIWVESEPGKGSVVNFSLPPQQI
jgi:signal transduction histidine kinase